MTDTNEAGATYSIVPLLSLSFVELVEGHGSVAMGTCKFIAVTVVACQAEDGLERSLWVSGTLPL